MDKKKRYTLKKNERLCSKVLLDKLFKKDNQIKQKAYPFLLVAKEVNNDLFSPPAQIVFSVSKKRIKKAVDRNHIRRKLKEGYRLNKHILYEPLLAHKKKLIISLIYLSNKPSSYKETEGKIIVILKRLKEHIEKPN